MGEQDERISTLGTTALNYVVPSVLIAVSLGVLGAGWTVYNQTQSHAADLRAIATKQIEIAQEIKDLKQSLKSDNQRFDERLDSLSEKIIRLESRN